MTRRTHRILACFYYADRPLAAAALQRMTGLWRISPRLSRLVAAGLVAPGDQPALGVPEERSYRLTREGRRHCEALWRAPSLFTPPEPWG